MRYQTDQWVIYDPYRDNAVLSKPKRAVILYVYKESDRDRYYTRGYDYEIYIDEGSGIHRKVKEKDLYPIDEAEKK